MFLKLNRRDTRIRKKYNTKKLKLNAIKKKINVSLHLFVINVISVSPSR